MFKRLIEAIRENTAATNVLTEALRDHRRELERLRLAWEAMATAARDALLTGQPEEYTDA